MASALNIVVTQLTGNPIVLQTRLPGVKLFSRGKVRDIYEIDSDRLLIVATDRLSAFDVVMAEGIPDKGLVLTQLSCFWFEFFRGVIPSHFLTANIGSPLGAIRAWKTRMLTITTRQEEMKKMPSSRLRSRANSDWKAS